MMRKCLITFTGVIVLLTSPYILSGQKPALDFKNQVSLQSGLNFRSPAGYMAGARYIPSLEPSVAVGKNGKIDAELSVNSYANFFFTGRRYDSVSYNLKLYRLWLRYSTPKLEIRAGLQKINFGSASILRPLMWFDKMDYRDPLRLTDGVTGILGRYYFKNNANLWLWSLIGNDKVKGWESAPSVKRIPEYGGRVQLPVPKGEIAASFNHRVADYYRFYAISSIPLNTEYSESWLSLDGKWDIGPGIWFEAVAKINDRNNHRFSRYESFLNLGADYTFGIGNSLTVTSEFLRYENYPGEGIGKLYRNFSALSVNYPVYLSNSVSLLLYYNWDTGDWYRLLNLQVKFDYLSFYLMGFWNPSSFNIYGNEGSGNLFAGKGIQLMIVLNI